VTARPLDDAELVRFGVRLEDEGPHPFDPAERHWNESWFWDWFDEAGEVAGHCRIGLHPVQNRLWIWFYLYQRGEWVAVEETRLPATALRLPEIAYDDGFGLRFAWEPRAPLRAGRFCFAGFGRVLSGPRAGLVLPVAADLEVEALGAPHAPPQRAAVAGHSSVAYHASRFEQPIASRGTLRIGDAEIPFEGRGERDHSWGPRHWNLEWIFLVLNGAGLCMQCAEARVPGAGRFAGGYLQRAEARPIEEVVFELEFDDARVLAPVSGHFAVKAADGSGFGGRIEVVSAAEIDITHTFVPPQRTVYRRALIRVHPDIPEKDTGGQPLLGWIEFNRMPARS
jgi:hypothetical protein